MQHEHSPDLPRTPRSPLRRGALRMIDTYRAEVSHRLDTRCRLQPTCSAYARDAYARHWFAVASMLTMARLVRCGRAGHVHERRASRALALVAAMGAVVFAVLLPYAATPAFAQVTGPCKGTIAGVSADQASTPETAVRVDYNQQVEVFGAMSSGPLSYYVDLEFAGFRWTVKEGATDGATWTSTVNVADYATYGVGLYKVHAGSSNAAGETCTAVAYVRVGGKSPMTTLAGMAGIGSLALGGAAIGGATLRAASGQPPLTMEEMSEEAAKQAEEQARKDAEFWARLRQREEEHRRDCFDNMCSIGLFAALFLTFAALFRNHFGRPGS